jgi:hypothetical protein
MVHNILSTRQPTLSEDLDSTLNIWIEMCETKVEEQPSVVELGHE